MSLYYGSNKIKEVYYGSNKIGKVYYGSQLVYESIKKFVTFKSNSQFSLTHTGVSSTLATNDGNLQYSTDGVNWTNWNVADASVSSSVTSSSSGYLFVRQVGGTCLHRTFQFSNTSNLTVSGDVRMLIDCNDFENVNTTEGSAKQCDLRQLFKAQPVVDASGLIFPFTEISYGYNFREMFTNCSSLISAPAELPFTWANFYACYAMFAGCTSLVNPPKMTSIKVGYQGLNRMFYGCTALKKVPQGLKIAGFKGSATGITEKMVIQCCTAMFYNCTSLEEVVPITATSFASENDSSQIASTAFDDMYRNCSSLKQMPKFYPLSGYASSTMYRMLESGSYSAGNSPTRAYTSPRAGFTQAYRIPWTGTGTSTSSIKRPFFIDDTQTVNKTISLNTTYYISDSITLV